MSGTAAAETDATGTTTSETSSEQQTSTEGDKTSDVDWKAKAREWEKRAKANADAASKLAALEESQKTEAQKLADAKTAAEQAAAEAKAEALRWKIAAKHGISDDDAELFLTGTDEDTLTKQAERLAGVASDRKKNGNHASKEGATQKAAKADDLSEFARHVFGRSD